MYSGLRGEGEVVQSRRLRLEAAATGLALKSLSCGGGLTGSLTGLGAKTC